MAVLASTLLAADYPFLDVMWSMFIFFAWVIFIYLLILVLADNFRRRTTRAGRRRDGRCSSSSSR